MTTSPTSQTRAALQHDVDHPGTTRVLAIAGLGRSGSTLIEGALADGQQLVALGEVVHLWDHALGRDELCACGTPFGECAFWSAVGAEAFGGWDRVDLARMRSLQAKVDRVVNLPRIAGHGTRTGFRRELLDYVWHYERIYQSAATISGARMVIDSSKQPSLVAALLTSERLDVRVLHCVRDSRAVAHSWTKQVRRPEARDDAGAFMTRYSPATTARHWNIHNGAADALRLLGARVERVRYEDFVEDAPATVTRIQRFAGLVPGPPAGLTRHTVEMAPQHRCSGNPMRFSTGLVAVRRDDAWRTAMSARDQRTVSLLRAPLLRRYGYTVRPSS